MDDYNKLKAICDEIDVLIAKGVSEDTPEFIAWHVKAERFLIRKFGEDSFEHTKFLNSEFSVRGYGYNYLDYVSACASGLETTKGIFNTYLEEIKEENEMVNARNGKTISHFDNFSKVFVVHGHNGELRESVARLLEKQGIEAIILSEQANNGKTIIEKFEEYGDVSAAICLFTADDSGKANHFDVYSKRARQNVVFETGYFIGKLGRKNVIIISDKNVEIPSDMQGIVYIDSEAWQFTVMKNLKNMGFHIDLNKCF